MESRWILMFEETLNGLLMDLKKTLNGISYMKFILIQYTMKLLNGCFIHP
jgi:hypothetical protein